MPSFRCIEDHKIFAILATNNLYQRMWWNLLNSQFFCFTRFIEPAGFCFIQEKWQHLTDQLIQTDRVQSNYKFTAWSTLYKTNTKGLDTRAFKWGIVCLSTTITFEEIRGYVKKCLFLLYKINIFWHNLLFLQKLW